MLEGIRHTGIVVADLDAMLRFYRDLLGCRVHTEMDESGTYIENMLAIKGVRVRTVKLAVPGGGGIELLDFQSPSPVEMPPRAPAECGLTHMAFQVDDIERTYGDLVAAGISFNAPPQDSPDGKARVTFCRDPEGNLVEIVELTGR